MSSPIQQEVLDEINGIFRILVSEALVDDQNPPIRRDQLSGRSTITYANSIAGAAFLKNMQYMELYEEIRMRRAYNFRMPDGALVQMDYEFEANSLRRHRLAFLPSPNRIQYQNEPEIYERDEIYGDIVDPRQVAVPLRFDYDSRESVVNSMTHPVSHLTLGQYQHCRVPVTSGVTPRAFMNLILTSFYNPASISAEGPLGESSLFFPESITMEERRMIHVATPIQ